MKLVWAIIPLILFGVVGMQESFAEENSSITYEKNFKFSVTTDKKYYDKEDIIHIFWQVINTGDHDTTYTTSSTCGDGFSLSILDSNLHRIDGKLGESAKLIDIHDPVVHKFESSGFYGDVLQLIRDSPNETRDVLIFTSNGDKMLNTLIEKFEVKKYSDSSAGPDAVGARISAKYIPEIAKMDLVTNIIAGDEPVCGSAELTKNLKPNQSINGTYSWSQLVQAKDSVPQHVAEGYYSIGVKFDTISNCVTVGIDTDGHVPEFPCGFGGIPPWLKQDVTGWAHNKADDSEFVSAVQYMIKDNIITLEEKPNQSEIISESKVPDWVRKSALWWAEGHISNGDFVKGIEYMVNAGIIKIENNPT